MFREPPSGGSRLEWAALVFDLCKSVRPTGVRIFFAQPEIRNEPIYLESSHKRRSRLRKDAPRRLSDPSSVAGVRIQVSQGSTILIATWYPLPAINHSDKNQFRPAVMAPHLLWATDLIPLEL